VGAAALVATSGDAPTILINDREEADGTFVLGGPGMYDVTGLFAGGLGKITYTAAKADVEGEGQDAGPDALAMAKYEASIEEGTSTLTITWKAAMAALLHADVFTIDVSATDEAKTTVTTQVMAQRNKAPEATTTPIPTLRLGTQDTKRPAGNDQWPTGPYTCETLNACKLTVGGTSYIMDEQSDLIYSAVADSAHVRLSPVDGGIMIVGVMSTAKADDGMNGPGQAVTITLTAMDKGTLSVERTFKVNVDGPPTAGKYPLPAQTITESGMIELRHYFSDPEKQTITYEVEVEENPHITADESGGVLMLGLAMNGIPGGPIAVKITGTEPSDGTTGVGQSHEITVMVERE
jgi:hypothetical protein